MKKTLSMLMLAALSAGATAQSPQSDQDTETVNVPGHYLAIELPAYYSRMDWSEFRRYIAGYTLSNGQTMYLKYHGLLGMYAQIDQGPEHRIVATGKDSFVALDRQLKMHLDFDGDDAVGGEVVMVVPNTSTLAGGAETRVLTLTAR